MNLQRLSVACSCLALPWLKEGKLGGIPSFKGACHEPDIGVGVMADEGVVLDLVELGFVVEADFQQLFADLP